MSTPRPSEAQALAAARVACIEHLGLTDAPEAVVDQVMEAVTWGWHERTVDLRARLRDEATRVALRTHGPAPACR